jgi:hypothetical protein
MANVAAGMSFALGQQNWLNFGLEKLKIQRRGLRECRGGHEQEKQGSHKGTLPFVRANGQDSKNLSTVPSRGR